MLCILKSLLNTRFNKNGNNDKIYVLKSIEELEQCVFLKLLFKYTLRLRMLFFLVELLILIYVVFIWRFYGLTFLPMGDWTCLNKNSCSNVILLRLKDLLYFKKFFESPFYKILEHKALLNEHVCVVASQ